MPTLPSKLPTRDSLGPMPSGRSDRPLARVDTTAIGEGAAALGRAAVQLGASLGKKAEEDAEKAEALEIERRLLLYSRDTERDLEEGRRHMQPGGAGFSETWRRSYDSGARGVIDQAQRDGLSDRALGRLDVGLLRLAERLQTRAYRHELDEEDRFNEETVLGKLNDYIRDVRASPSTLAERRRLGELEIQQSRLAATTRYSVRRQFLRNIENEARTALIEGISTSRDADRANELVIGRIVPDRRPLRDRGGRILEPGAEPGPSTRGRLGIGRSVYNYFIERGLQPHQAAAYAGNFAWEGGGRADLVNPNDNTRNSPDSPHSAGVGQWNDRLPALVAFARQQGIDIPEGDLRDVRYVRDVIGRIPLRTQLDFAWAEQQGPEARAARGVGQAQDLRSGVAAAIGYHRPAGWTRDNPEAGHGFGDRLALATRILQDAEATPGTGGPPALGGPPVEAAPGQGLDLADAAAGAPARPPMRVGGPEWVEAQLAAEERGEGVRESAFMNTSAAQARAFANAVNARRTQIRTQLQSTFAGWEAQARDGVPPPEALVQQVREQVEAFDDPQLTENFEFLVGGPPSERFPQGRPGLAVTVQGLRRLPPVQMEAVIQAEERRQQQQGATELDKKRLDHLRAVLKNARTEIARDPNGWAVSVGVEDGAAWTFDPADDASMRAHAEQARRVGRYLNQPPKFFSPEQVQAVQGILRQGGQPMLETLASMVRNWGEDAPAAMREFAPDDPELAAIGAMYLNAQANAGANMEAVERLAREVQLRQDPAYREMIKGYKPKAEELIDAKNIIGTAFRERPLTQAAAEAAAKLLYQSRARERQLDAFDANLFQEGLREVIGQTTERNVVYGGIWHQTRNRFGVRNRDPVPVPSGMRQDALPVVLNALRVQDVIDANGFGPVTDDGRYMDVADLRNMVLVAVGPGQYWLAQESPAPGVPARWVMDPRGERFVLDLNALEPMLRQRVPEIFRGYKGPVAYESMAGRLPPGSRPFGISPSEVILGPNHPDYPRGDFAPRVNPGRPVTVREWQDFERWFAERYPSGSERDRVRRTRSLFADEIRQFIDTLPPPREAGQ